MSRAAQREVLLDLIDLFERGPCFLCLCLNTVECMLQPGTAAQHGACRAVRDLLDLFHPTYDEVLYEDQNQTGWFGRLDNDIGNDERRLVLGFLLAMVEDGL